MPKSTKKASKKIAKKKGAGIKPLGDRVLIKPSNLEEEELTKSGIIIPDTVDKEKPSQGVVVAVGEGRRTEDGSLLPMAVSVGDKVVFSKYGPDEISINDNDYYIISESSILAIID